MDELDFFFLVMLPLIALFFGLMVFAATSAEPTRLQVVCDNLDGKVVENVCIKNGAVVYKD